MTDVRRERQAARRRTLQVLTERRLQRRVIDLRDLRLGGQHPARTPLAQASISSTTRTPTDS